MAAVIKKMGAIIELFLPTARAILTLKGVCHISWRSRLRGKVKLGRRTRIFPWCILKGKVTMGKQCTLHEHSFIHGDVTIGDYCRIADGVRMHSNNHMMAKGKLIKDQKNTAGKIIIGKDVWIGCGAIILQDVKISDGAVIGAGAIVTKSVGLNEIWVGNPARKIGVRK